MAGAQPIGTAAAISSRTANRAVTGLNGIRLFPLLCGCLSFGGLAAQFQALFLSFPPAGQFSLSFTHGHVLLSTKIADEISLHTIAKTGWFVNKIAAAAGASGQQPEVGRGIFEAFLLAPDLHFSLDFLSLID